MKQDPYTEVPHVVGRQSIEFICLGDPARCIRATLFYVRRGRVHSLHCISIFYSGSTTLKVGTAGPNVSNVKLQIKLGHDTEP